MTEQQNPYAVKEPLINDSLGVNRGDFDGPTLRKIEAIIVEQLSQLFG